ncbi:MAG: hypothetical protein ACRDZX_10550, partial [Acidimicrobiales bacterium]
MPVPALVRAGAVARRAAEVLVAVAALVAGLVVPASTAYASLTSAPYAIGAQTSAVLAVVASPDAVPKAMPADFEVSFRSTAPLSGAAAGQVAIASSVPLGNAPAGISLRDATSGGCSQHGAGGGTSGAAGITVALASGCTISPGDEVEVAFAATSPAITVNFTFRVTTSANEAPGVSNPVSVVAAPPAFSASSRSLGASATYTVSGASWTPETLRHPANALVVTAGAVSGGSLSWSGVASGYSVGYVAPGGTTRPDPVTRVVLGRTANPADTVTVMLSTPVTAGERVVVEAKGANPSTASRDEVSLSPAAPSGSPLSPGSEETSANAVSFGTSVSGVSVTASPPVAGALATYVVSFVATSPMTGGAAQVCLDESDGPTTFATENATLVTDTTAGWHFAARGLSFPSASASANPDCASPEAGAVIPLTAGYHVSAGDSLSITTADVTNPPAGAVSDFGVSTSSDTVAAFAPPYGVGVE